jgi:hypothetical protein
VKRELAIKILGKMLGKNLGYRVDDDAPSPDERREAQGALAEARSTKDYWAEKKAQACTRALAADKDYQECVKQHEAALEALKELQFVALRYKFTVGTSSSMFFQVKAQGDSWEDCIAKLEGKQS